LGLAQAKHAIQQSRQSNTHICIVGDREDKYASSVGLLSPRTQMRERLEAYATEAEQASGQGWSEESWGAMSASSLAPGEGGGRSTVVTAVSCG